MGSDPGIILNGAGALLGTPPPHGSRTQHILTLRNKILLVVKSFVWAGVPHRTAPRLSASPDRSAPVKPLAVGQPRRGADPRAAAGEHGERS
jgi:hypothetical protein